jgi:hypothetical protein
LVLATDDSVGELSIVFIPELASISLVLPVFSLVPFSLILRCSLVPHSLLVFCFHIIPFFLDVAFTAIAIVVVYLIFLVTLTLVVTVFIILIACCASDSDRRRQ